MAATLALLPLWNQAACTLCDYTVTTADALSELVAHYMTHHASENT